MSRRQIVERMRARLDTGALAWTYPSTRKPTIHLAVPRAIFKQIESEWQAAQRRGLTQKEFATDWAQRMAAAPPQKKLSEAVADGEFMACPGCFTIQRRVQQRIATCVFCGQSYPRREGVALARAGFETAYYGWYYGAAHEAEGRRRRRRRAFRLPEPGPFLWTLGVFIALAVASGLTWDIIKKVAGRLYSRYKRWRTSGALLTDAEAVRNLRTLRQWAVDYLSDEFPGEQLRRELLKHVRITHVRGPGRHILEVSLKTEADVPKPRSRGTQPTTRPRTSERTGRQVRRRKPRRRPKTRQRK